MRRLGYSLLIFLTCLLGVVLAPSRQSVRAQGVQPAVLVIDGGTLIDGNGGAPIRDAQVVIEGNKITRIGRKGQRSAAPDESGSVTVEELRKEKAKNEDSWERLRSTRRP